MTTRWLQFLTCALLIGGLTACGGSGSAPSSIAGTWEFEIVGGSCPDLNSGVLNPGSGPPAVFQVSQSGLTVSAQFVDQGGGTCSFAAQYSGDQVRGVLEVQSFGRTVRATVEGYARVVGGQRFVDGWARVEFDSENQCVGEVIEFCAKVDGEGETDPILVTCPPVDIVFIMDTSGSMDDEAAALCGEIQNIADALTALGLESIRTFAYGITQNAGEASSEVPNPFECLTDSVRDLPGPAAAGTGPGVNGGIRAFWR
mgnify:FL=1